MGMTMIISLYSTRLILSSLGASDFGIFNVVGGAIAMLGFLNSTMANATQRFMSYAEGEGVQEKKRIIFNVSLILHVAIATITIILLLATMPLLFDCVFNIEESRVPSAKIIYMCLIFSTVLTIINVPYDAVMNAHENMLYYSIIGIVESLLKLVVAFICVYTKSDKLVVYGILMAAIPLISLSYMKFYCHRHYDECIIAPRHYWDRTQVKKISTFFGWNFLTAISSLFSAQGIGVVLNHFFGTILNAAQGIANQVNGVLTNFSGNMMKALNPIVVKSAGANDIKAMNMATLIGCKYSALITMFFAIPLALEVDLVLKLWLVEVPRWATIFIVLQLIEIIIVQMANTASTEIYANGDIKHYAMWKSLMNATPVVLTWMAFKMGGSPIWLYIPMIVVWAIGGNIVIVYYAKEKCDFNIVAYFLQVVLPVIGTALIMLIFGALVIQIMGEGLLRLFFTCLLTSVGMLISAVTFAVTKHEMALFKGFISGITKKNIE